MNVWILEHLTVVSLVAIFAVPLLVIGVFFLFHHYYPHEATRWVVAQAVVNLVFAWPFTVWLNNEYALKRDRDSRRWALTQQHLAQLKPILRTDAERLEQIAKIRVPGGLPDPDKDPHSMRQDYYWQHDPLSSHLCRHFKEYCIEKQNLRREVDSQDQSFRSTLALIEGQVKVRGYPAMRREVALSALQRCLDMGRGITLTVEENSFKYSSATKTAGWSGKPSKADLAPYLGAYRAYKAFKPGAEIISHCRALRELRDAIAVRARALSAEASTLAQQTSLNGDCDFVRVE